MGFLLVIISFIFFYINLVDLNNEFLFDISYLINEISGYYKIGFKNPYSDYFYNIQLDLNSFEFLEKSYSKINTMLG